ncbi:guanylate kinase isoform X1 [Neodiprion pinetum]|uniref:guanylate kinase isoform X1 n=2 Tax=Neodiprion pinetum TaxID=441929 RepID=UPI001EE0A3F0|nr:guanylate kinase-like isoform X1 [Neodiprion pinetum]XP_046622254.1 guanylate kinase-like isoform X1 [Neodiprion virginianus]
MNIVVSIGPAVNQFIKGFCTMVQKGLRPLTICGPSGSGKSTLLKRLLEEYPDIFGFSVSHTTRSPRPGEEPGKHYHFTTKEQMQQDIDDGKFIESAIFSNNIYGTSKRAVEDVRRAGKVCVLDIDTQGVKQIRQTSLDPLLVFVKPPSIEELERRLRQRNTETEESLQRRLIIAKSEMEFGAQPGYFHLIIENDNVEKAYEQLREFVIGEINSQRQAGALAMYLLSMKTSEGDDCSTRET